MRARDRSAMASLAAAALVLSILATSAQHASALTINATFLDEGNLFPATPFVAEAPPAATGGGDWKGIVGAAIDRWEAAIPDPYNLSLAFGWFTLANPPTGQHFLISQGGVPNRETQGNIVFYRNVNQWFFDSTPTDNSDFSTFTAFSADLGGGTINTGRVFTGPSPDAAGRSDLFTFALHEIGHALGLSGDNISFIAESGDCDVDVVSPRSFPGTTIPLANCGPHLSLANALMFTGAFAGTRRLEADIDILTMCELSEFTGGLCGQANGGEEGGKVPGSATGLLVVLGAAGLGVLVRRPSRR